MAQLTERLLLAEMLRLYPEPGRLFAVAYRAGAALGRLSVSAAPALRGDAPALAAEVWRAMFGRAGGEGPRPRTGGPGGQTPGLTGARLPAWLREAYGARPGEPLRVLVEGALSGALGALGWDAEVCYEGGEVALRGAGEGGRGVAA